MDISDAAGDRARSTTEIGFLEEIAPSASSRLRKAAARRPDGLDDGDMEFAPGSPWNAIFSFLSCAPLQQLSFGQYLASCRGPPGCRRHGTGVDDGDADPLPASVGNCSSFSCFSSGDGGNAVRAPRCAAISIEADMVAWPVPEGAGRATARTAAPIGEPIAFTTFDWRSFSVWISAASVAISTAGYERRQHVADIVRRDGRKIALQIDDDLASAVGIEGFQRFHRSGRRRGVRGCNITTSRGPSPRPRSPASVATATRPISALRAAARTIIGRPAMSSSGAGQPRGCHAGRISTKAGLVIGFAASRAERVGMGRKSARRGGVVSAGKPISQPCWGCSVMPDPEAIRLFCRPKVDIQAGPDRMDSELNKILGAVLGTCLFSW